MLFVVSPCHSEILQLFMSAYQMQMMLEGAEVEDSLDDQIRRGLMSRVHTQAEHGLQCSFWQWCG